MFHEDRCSVKCHQCGEINVTGRGESPIVEKHGITVGLDCYRKSLQVPQAWVVEAIVKLFK